MGSSQPSSVEASISKANAITFGEYRKFINDRHPEYTKVLDEACAFWGL
jgi:hypothetical protein